MDKIQLKMDVDQVGVVIAALDRDLDANPHHPDAIQLTGLVTWMRFRHSKVRALNDLTARG